MPAVADDRISTSIDRRDFAHPLFVHDDLIESLSTDDALGRRLKLVFSQLAAQGRTSIVKGCKDSVNRGWQRTPVAGNNRYLWWCHHDSDHAASLGLAQKSILIRTVRHHDNHDPLTSGDSGEYIQWQPADQAGGQLPWTERQKKFIYDSVPVRVLMGNPGSGKTTALWESVCARDGQTVLYLTWSSRLSELAKAHLESFAGKGVKPVVRELRTFWGELLGRDVRRVDLADSLKLFSQHTARISSNDLGEWRRLPMALYSEVRAVVYGMGSSGEKARFIGRLSAEEYLSARRAELGQAAEAIPRLVDSIEETLKPEQWIPDLCAAADVARLVDGKEVDLVLKRAGLGQLDRIVIDEAQDLTVLELRSLMKLFGAVAKKSGNLPFLLLAGDEGQTVVPTQFKWGQLKDTVYEVLQTIVDNPRNLISEHKLESNLRCPRNVCLLLERASDFYTSLPKVERPGDQLPPAEMQVHDARVLHVVSETGEDGIGVLDKLADRDDFAVLTLEDKPDGDIFGSLTDRVLRPADAKGLEYQSVCIVNPGRSLQRINKMVTEAGLLGAQSARTTIDQLRVALSRATGDLVFFDLNPGAEERRQSKEFLAQAIETDVLGLEKFFADAHHEPEDRVKARLELAESLEETDLRRAWRLAFECLRMLGNENLTNGVADTELRKQVLLAVLRLAARLVVVESQDSKYRDQVEDAAQSISTDGNIDLMRPLRRLLSWAKADAEGESHTETISLLQSVVSGGEEVAWVRPAIASIAQRLRAVLGEAAGKPGCAPKFTGPVERWLEATGQLEGVEQVSSDLRGAAFESLVKAGQLDDADELLVHFPDDLAKHAVWHEAAGDHMEAARLFQTSGKFGEALRNWRLSGAWEEAIRLAGDEDRKKLQWLRDLEEKLASKPGDLEEWMTRAEKKRFRDLLSER